MFNLGHEHMTLPIRDVESLVKLFGNLKIQLYCCLRMKRERTKKRKRAQQKSTLRVNTRCIQASSGRVETQSITRSKGK